LAKLGHRFGSPAMGRATGASGESEEDRSSTPGSALSRGQDKWKVGAKKALLQWCRQQVTSRFGVEVRDFGRSWRDGNAFLGIVNSIKPGISVETQTYQGEAGSEIASRKRKSLITATASLSD